MLVRLYIAGACALILFFFFFNDTATTEIYTLSLHDALPISALLITTNAGLTSWRSDWRPASSRVLQWLHWKPPVAETVLPGEDAVLEVVSPDGGDRKSTRLNSSHSQISYAVFCLKKKK